MNAHYTYFLVLAAALAGPLALSFDKKVAFYKSWKYVFPAMIIPAILYIGWDIFFTSVGVWSFNENYITGFHLVNLPIEEMLFFFVVPYCCLFIYACIQTYFPKLQPGSFTKASWWVLAVSLVGIGIFFYQRYYTSWAFFFCGLFMVTISAAPKWFPGLNRTAFFVSYLLILIPFLFVNGVLTSLPVVLYNDAENLGIRIYTIPFEDVFYGMLLILMNVTIYERLKVASPK
ncbi:MAG: lycopene cyclase domain-containing protein [Ferruginibacter sp.]|nr:lycopene cyclase domain-containing protein [Ferruginibacter sp.]